jgi:exodeoxyribonuclease-5
MELTTKQMQGLNLAIERYRNHEKYTVISGYAGSGKSTLVKFIVAALQIPEDKIVYACYTGKACNVLQKKGNKNVCTLHKLLYEHFPRPDGTFFRRPVASLEPYEIVVVDECSMASKDLIEQLLRHRVYVIFLGDPFQLPPINPEDDNHLLDKPHVFLDEIMRQAQESEIIRLSMDIRSGKSIELMNGKDVIVVGKNDVINGMYQWADQIICATNETRVKINNEMRQMLGREGSPKDGDKVICLRNYWGIIDNDGNPLVNGTIGMLKNNFDETIFYPRWLDGGGKFTAIRSDIVTEINSEFYDLRLDKKLILEGKETLDWKLKWKMGKNAALAPKIPLEFTYGYAITCHKSQGSQWPKVMVMEENFPFAKEEHARWLYTAVTRAEEKLVVVKK